MYVRIKCWYRTWMLKPGTLVFSPGPLVPLLDMYIYIYQYIHIYIYTICGCVLHGSTICLQNYPTRNQEILGPNLFQFRLHFKGRKSPVVLTPKKSGGRAPTYTAWRDHPWHAPTHTRQRHLPGIDGKIAYLDVSN